ncbi:MAG: hypothetical protein M1837_000428 [Sclerophora amabilis]|nr:MAG: hypothetical protein M1837_000428 [Sclerophora amabilis]
MLSARSSTQAKSISPETEIAIHKRREQLTPALVCTWNSSSIRVLCPFPSCKKIHTHGYTRPEPSRLNARKSHCELLDLTYRILFPFENDPAVSGLGFEIDRVRCRWKTVGIEEDDSDDEDEDDGLMNGLGDGMGQLIIGSSQTQPAMEVVNRDQEGQWFLSFSVLNDLDSVRALLDKSVDANRLIKGKDAMGNSALALVCMEGHQEMTKLLHQRGAEIDSTNNEHRTPLIEALSYGRGAVAAFLIEAGASTDVKDEEGTSISDVAKINLLELERSGWMCSRMENETMVRRSERECNRKRFEEVIAVCEARSNRRRVIKRMRAKSNDHKEILRILISERGYAPEISVMKSRVTVRVANEWKAFAYLDRGPPWKEVFAVSGWSRGPFGMTDGCLDREVWVKRVFAFSRVLGHRLALDSTNDRGQPGRFNASHAEKQVMAYVLWKHTTILLEDEKTEAQHPDLEELISSQPAELGMKLDIYVSKNKICEDCENFRKRIQMKTGINFDIKALPAT